ncbi:transcriptional regulator, LacI family [Cohaesibacter sp. ES.047]|uniref:LacI family DNA-binding transcriptional regulator n=1 Tax=Cohaesibacter sp. ES.047 TaxID=1798205 RepID=UPI000BB8116C|nr:LacI family DNA-binding transcriptional regulator [Cohaesibacter sp. ES.047]SNY90248.1 transcriptional regulator, LacI family [Cohaesibacter sp. ES.047]
MKTTLGAIAREANVSVATVDRVLNDREGVKPHTREVVLHVARKLGYFSSDGKEPQHLRLDFLLPAGGNSFIQQLQTQLQEETESRSQIDARVHWIDWFDSENLAAMFAGLIGKTDAVAIVAIDNPTVREGISKLTEAGIKVAMLVSDIPGAPKVGYVGINNRSAGRLAGYLIGRFLPRDATAKLALFVGSLSYRGHEERMMGIRSVLSHEFPTIQISEMIEFNDRRETAYTLAKKLLKEAPPDAIYNIGSGNQGIAQALRESEHARNIIFIGHDLTTASREMLLDRTMDAVIDQDFRAEAREVVKLLISSVENSCELEYPPRLQVFFRENLP